ncbi:M56 family metallopeptidase [Pedobacter cryophilus]|uniref:TonB family protein n=1 Tax=Pedobacter cryophilus TaxID=2571271 RepID=A0A4U1C7U5_9SPHI|nr:M56 family metallopeptidase [Pedobacter cryophilus]TKC00744.1 TonB family protein [Pedobacter cryophilus]
MNWANYLIQINLYLMLFYAFYIFILRNETFFNLNRTYLLSTSIFALMIPLYRTNWVQSFFITEKVQTSWTSVNMMMLQGFASPIVEETIWTLGDYLTFVYLFMMIFLVLRLIYRLTRVQKMLNSDHHPEAFSFFRKVRVNPDLPQKEQIEKHEQTHAKQLHSADVLFLEILCIINWFNPIVYLYKKSIRHIHEFIADEQALHLQNNKKDYALLLFSKSFGINPNSLTNNFFNQSLLKRRIQMLQKPKSRKTALLKYGLSAPLFLIAMILSSATISENKNLKTIAKQVAPKHNITESLPNLNSKKEVTNKIFKDPTTINQITSANLENIDSVFTKVDELPSFPGGLQAFGMFLGENMKYPALARDNKIQGRVFVQFVVEKDGSLSEIKVVRGIGSGCDEEAVRVLALSPKWTPGMQNGKVVRVSYVVPIFFQMKGATGKTPPPPPAPSVNGTPPPPPAPMDISSSNNALFIVDGLEYKGDKNNLKKDLNPNEIESINVLKGEAAIKKYGDKGKDGVIEITTKKKE